MSGHTPGPWEVSTWASDGTASGVYQEDPETGDDESEICDFDRDEDPKVRMANAKLIAAAPDLLAACEAAYDRLEALGYGDEIPCMILRAAIGKAKG